MHELVFPYQLRRGHTDDPSEGACAMDAINWLVHGKHGDMPECACPLIACYVQKVNDLANDTGRMLLIPYLHRIAGSRSHKHEPARADVLMSEIRRRFGSHEAMKLSYPEGDRYLRHACVMLSIGQYCGATDDVFRAFAEGISAIPPTLYDVLAILDEMLCAGPEGEPWSVDVVDRGVAAFELARTQGLQPQC